MKKRIKRGMLYLLLLSLVYVFLVVLVNRWIPPTAVKSYQPSRSITAVVEPVRQLKVVTWNLGYAGLGAEANFVADGGEDLLPESRELVLRNAAAISEQIPKFDADIIFLQEAAASSFVNRNVELRNRVQKSVPEMSAVYAYDVQSWLVPYPLKMDTGKLTLTNLPTIESEGILLPLEDTYYAGFLLREYRMVVSRLDVGHEQELVAINVHLAAFDDGSTRQQQVNAILKFAEIEFQNGNYVLIGGDWNLRLTSTDFPHRTEDEHLFWLADFPFEKVPEGWQLVSDNQVPSVRTVHQAYAKGDNYVCTVDGYLLSPNLVSSNVENLDLDFQNSDHHPSVLTFELKPIDGSSVIQE